MKFESFDYKVSAELTFARAEYLALIDLAKAHYDDKCREAGLVIGEHGQHGEVGRVNGFLAQLRLFPSCAEATTVVWTSDKVDLTLKILEMRWTFYPAGAERAMCDRLNSELFDAFDKIRTEYARLTKERP